MENLKLVRKVKKITNRQLQRERDMLAATQVRMPAYCSANRDNYDPYFESNSSQEGRLFLLRYLSRLYFQFLFLFI